MMNILNGGAHASNNVEIQEFMIVPVGAPNFSEGLRAGSEIYHALGKLLCARGLASTVGDEGGFAPNLSSDEEAIELLIKAIKESGYSPESEVKIALDAASSEWYDGNNYYLKKRGKIYTSDELINYFSLLAERYPIISIEDPLADVDARGWERITEKFKGKGIMLVGDDLFTTNSERILEGFSKKRANSVLIKPNQIGTLTETHEAVSIAKEVGYKTIMSHRSGETEDTFIADLAVALSADFVKMGAPARAERTSKYNRLMKIESEIFAARYGFS
jgi:enolase